MTNSEQVFKPYWPPELKVRDSFELRCDDKLEAKLDIHLGVDGDVYVSMQEWAEDCKEPIPDPFPSIRVRTYFGGGRNLRTRQALLWLAEAIRLDNLDNK